MMLFGFKSNINLQLKELLEFQLKNERNSNMGSFARLNLKITFV